jgi:hypothetical protein
MRPSNARHMKFRCFLASLLAVLTLYTGCASAIGHEVEVVFTKKDLQDAIDKAPKSAIMVDGILVLSLDGNPLIALGDSPNRIGVFARMLLQVVGTQPIPASFSGSAGLVYNETKKAFFMEAPVIESIDAAFLPKALEAAARVAISNQLGKTFSVTPVYVLRGNGNLKERTARQLLKSIQIRKDAVVAKFAVL